MKEMKVTIKGVSPTILHNNQMVDPLNPFNKRMKEYTGKRKKTDEDYIAMARLEHEAGLYLDAQGWPCWPGLNIEAMIVAAAKTIKLGRLVKSSIIVDGNFRIDQPHGKDLDELFEKARITAAAKVQMSTVMRTRPIFDPWSLTFTILYNEDLINARDIKQILDIAGTQIGLSDWRPRYGRFIVEKVK